MKSRIINGWNIVRIAYLVLGLIIAIQSVLQREWIGLLLGIWFAGMSLFAVGCAGGSCNFTNRSNPD